MALSIATPRPPRSERHGSELTARQPLSLAATDPEVLVYERRNNGSLKLVAVEYVVFTSAVSEQPKLFGIPFDYNDGSRYGLDPFWALHAWIWKPNPSDPAGIFNARNPRVS